MATAERKKRKREMEKVWKWINPGLKDPECSNLEFTFSKGYFSYSISLSICYQKHPGIYSTKLHCTTYKKKKQLFFF